MSKFARSLRTLAFGVVCTLSLTSARPAHATSVDDGGSIIDNIIETWDYAGAFGDGSTVFSDTVDGTTVYAILDPGGNLTLTNVDPFAGSTP
jgi:hypothetical protein